jgi:hypothetical protein
LFPPIRPIFVRPSLCLFYSNVQGELAVKVYYKLVKPQEKPGWILKVKDLKPEENFIGSEINW